jgi:hypothetical protein
MALAITPFEGMCGFRQLEVIAGYLTTVPELKAVVGDAAGRIGLGLCVAIVIGVIRVEVALIVALVCTSLNNFDFDDGIDAFQQAVTGKKSAKTALQPLFTALMKANPDLIKTQLTVLEVTNSQDLVYCTVLNTCWGIQARLSAVPEADRDLVTQFVLRLCEQYPGESSGETGPLSPPTYPHTALLCRGRRHFLLVLAQHCAIATWRGNVLGT